MSQYIGAECLICKNKFSTEDEIVVCPECGTPYHRECYIKQGSCINHELHEKKGSWKATYESDDTQAEKTRCKNCGELNPKNGLFCTSCGKSLLGDFDTKQNYSQFQGSDIRGAFTGIPPFFQQAMDQMNSGERITDETELDGIKVKQYNQFIKSNNLYYLPQFIKFSKTEKKTSFNLAAAFVPEIYFFFRKMTAAGVVFFLFFSAFQIMGLSTYFADETLMMKFPVVYEKIRSIFSVQSLKLISLISLIGMFALRLVAGFFANYLYFLKAKKSINKINKMDKTESEKSDIITKKGGISKVAVYIFVSLIVLSYIAIQYLQ